MRAFIRWLASREIADAQMRGYRDGISTCISAIRKAASQEGPGREREREVMEAAANGIDDALQQDDRLLAKMKEPTP